MLPSVFVSHGSPMLAVTQSDATQAMRKLSNILPKPHAIVIMSAHWLMPKLTVNATPVHQTLHDFYGFPDDLYQIQYPAYNDTEIVKLIVHYLDKAQLHPDIIRHHPLDHGVWAPLLHMYPYADVPIVPLSLPYNMSARAVFDIGEALSDLCQQQVLVMGSGSLTHNLCRVRTGSSAVDMDIQLFSDYARHSLASNPEQLFDWFNHPLARIAHPSDEHFLPLFFAQGAGRQWQSFYEGYEDYSLAMDIYTFGDMPVQ